MRTSPCIVQHQVQVAEAEVRDSDLVVVVEREELISMFLPTLMLLLLPGLWGLARRQSFQAMAEMQASAGKRQVSGER